MSAERRQLTYRIEDDLRGQLEAVARQERQNIQTTLDRAIEQYVQSRLLPPTGDVLKEAGLSELEREFVQEMLWFHRNADRETIRDVRSMVKVMRRGAEASGRVARELKVG